LRDRAEAARSVHQNENRDRSVARPTSQIPVSIRHVLGVGARWQNEPLDARLIAKIIRAEIGSGEEIVSSDGVVSVVCKPGK
jgi:hypothetical protein